jgi:hypothetical protein
MIYSKQAQKFDKMLLPYIMYYGQHVHRVHVGIIRLDVRET